MIYQDDQRNITLIMRTLPKAITFPVLLGYDYECHQDFAERKLAIMPPKWHLLKTGIPIRHREYADNVPPASYRHIGILTGKRSNITVIQCSSSYMKKITGLDSIDTLCVVRGCNSFYYFEYEESLHSIYGLIHGGDIASVWNEDCCVFAGWRYKVQEDSPISKMPNSVLAIFQDAQNKRKQQYDLKMYELMNLLPDDWFNDLEEGKMNVLESKHIRMLIHVVKNAPIITDEVRLNTLRKLLRDRWDYLHEYTMICRFNDLMTYKERQIGVAVLKKLARDLNRNGYEAWSHKWSGRIDDKLKYKKGALVKLKDVKQFYDKASLSRVMKRHPKLEIVKKHICKSCKQLLHTKCCADYHRFNQSTTMFIMNGYLAK